MAKVILTAIGMEIPDSQMAGKMVAKTRMDAADNLIRTVVGNKINGLAKTTLIGIMVGETPVTGLVTVTTLVGEIGLMTVTTLVGKTIGEIPAIGPGATTQTGKALTIGKTDRTPTIGKMVGKTQIGPETKIHPTPGPTVAILGGLAILLGLLHVSPETHTDGTPLFSIKPHLQAQRQAQVRQLINPKFPNKILLCANSQIYPVFVNLQHI